MVYRKTSWRASVKTNSQNRSLTTALCILLLLIIVLSCMLIYSFQRQKTTLELEEGTNVPATSGLGPDKIEFQSTIDDWVNSTAGDRSVIIYDLDRDEVAGAYNSSENYNIDSLYKLFVVYEGYKRVQSGEWDAADVLDCLDLAIRESDSICAETLWDNIGTTELDEAFNLNISDFSLSSEDIAGIMKSFYHLPETLDNSLATRMKDSFLNQPETTYNWRQGLPNGFAKANVYNKVGWDFNTDAGYWNTYHDAAIVEYPAENRHFVVVVMTSHVPFQAISKLGALIEEAFLVSTKEL